MYEAFYRLTEPPFRLTPDPRYLYLSAHHREALGHLLFGIREGSGFVAVTGEIGTGKTTLLRTLLLDLEPTTTVAYIFNPVLSDLELLQAINSEFRLPADSTSKKELVDELNRFLMAQKLAGTRVVVIVDEAQNLSPTVLEQLRLLSNLETETEKLLQIVLVGQPELREMLARPELEQLNQRITVRWHLAPLDRKETTEYVRHRLRIAGGANATKLFTTGALRQLYRYAGGVPRLINIAAHRALLTGFTRERRVIDAPTVRRAMHELQRDERPPDVRPRLLWPLAGAATTAVALAFASALAVVPPPRHLLYPATHGPTPLPSVAPPNTVAPAEGMGAAEALPGVHLSMAPKDAGDPSRPSVPVEAASAPPAPTSAPTDLPRTVETPIRPPATAMPEIGSAAAPPAVPTATPAADADVLAALAVPAAAPTATAPTGDPSAVGADAFWAMLAASDNRGTALSATVDLLAAWATEPLSAEERAKASLDLWAIAEHRGLRYLPTSGNLQRLQLLNVPAILELSVPPSRQRRFAVLTALADNRAQLRSGTTVTVLTADELSHAWLGDAHVFWRDFENLSAYLAPGSTGADVERLQQLLSRAGEFHGTPSQRYDRATTEAIARFQRSRRLVPDGIVGPLTKILLYAAVGGYDHPSLGADS